MDNLDVEGLFWKNGHEDDQVGGRLTFDSTHGANLDLIGALHGLDEFFTEEERPIRIHGVAGGKLLTLINCLRTNTSMQIPGISRERYQPWFVLAGCHIEESQPLVFDGMDLRLQHLDNWIRKTGTVVDLDSDQHSPEIRQIRVTHNPLKTESVPIEGGHLELFFTQSFNPDVFHTITLTQKAFLGVRFKEPQPIQRVFQTRTALMNLVTIGVGAPAYVDEIALEHPDLKRDSADGEIRPKKIDLYAQELRSDGRGEAHDIHPARMLFTFDEIGGLDGIAKWIKTSARFQTVISSVLSHWYLPRMYTDNRILNMIIAADALDRIRQNRQKLKFNEGLKRLAEFAGEPFHSLVENVEVWIREIVRVRTNNLVHRGLHADVDGSRMYWLSESLYFLVVICLLKECGISERTLARISSKQDYLLVKERLKQSS